MADLFELIATERRRTADLLETLTDDQWQVRSLCAEWTVRDMAGHLVLPFAMSKTRLVLGVLGAGGNFDRFSAKASQEVAQQPTSDLIAMLRRHAASHFTPPGLGPEAPLTDICVHTRDIARPLGLDLSAPPATWRIILDFVTSPRAKRGFVPPSRIANLSFRTADQDWSHGSGPEVAGPSEAVALALLGRGAALADLTGDGVQTLRARIG